MHIIGSAADFYRVRVLAIDSTEALDFEWRDDILYRRAPDAEIEEARAYTVEAVSLDDDEDTTILATFDTAEDAYRWADERTVELSELTKSDFENAYFPGAGI